MSKDKEKDNGVEQIWDNENNQEHLLRVPTTSDKEVVKEFKKRNAEFVFVQSPLGMEMNGRTILENEIH